MLSETDFKLISTQFRQKRFLKCYKKVFKNSFIFYSTVNPEVTSLSYLLSFLKSAQHIIFSIFIYLFDCFMQVDPADTILQASNNGGLWLVPNDHCPKGACKTIQWETVIGPKKEPMMQFTIQGSNRGWIGLAISRDKKMVHLMCSSNFQIYFEYGLLSFKLSTFFRQIAILTAVLKVLLSYLPGSRTASKQ